MNLQSEDSKEAIALTNKLLNESSTRRAGLLILRCLLGQLQTDLLQANAVSWLQQTVKGLTQIDSPDTVIAAVDLLSNNFILYSQKTALFRGTADAELG